MNDAAPTLATPASDAPAADPLGALSSQERSHWRLTGELPTQTEPASDLGEGAADESPNVDRTSLPGQPGDQAAETAASIPPASKPGTPSKKSNADTRKAELNAEILALKNERDRLRAERESYQAPTYQPPVVTPESRPASPPDLASTLSNPDTRQPMLTEESFWQQFPNATVGDFARYVARYELRAESALRDDYTARKTRVDPFYSRLEQRKAEDPAYLDRIDARVKALVPVDLLPPGTRPNAGNIIAQAVVTSPQSLELMEHLTEHPEVLDRLHASPSADVIVREIGRLESKLETSKTATPAAPAALPVSLAPAPTVTLGSKPSQPADELADAIRTGDFARYRELQNRKEMKRA